MRTIVITLSVLGILLVAGGLWLDALFEEPGARRIESLATELDAHTLLCVFAHPDDEVTVAGALADATSRNVRVHVITATRGEQGTSDVAVSGPEELGRIREAELRAHTALLGVDEQQVWEFPDSGVDAHLEELTERIERAIAEISPDVVLTFHPASGYTNHRDHRAVGLATVRALERSGSQARLVHSAAPRKVMAMFGGEAGAEVAAKQPAATLSLRIDPSIKLRAWTIHASQREYVRRAWGMPPRILHFFFDEEHYLVPEGAETGS